MDGASPCPHSETVMVTEREGRWGVGYLSSRVTLSRGTFRPRSCSMFSVTFSVSYGGGEKEGKLRGSVCIHCLSSAPPLSPRSRRGNR